MSALIIDGNRIAQDIRGEVAGGVKAFTAKHGYAPGLAAVLVGDDPASAVYVRNKERACGEVGIFSETFNLPQDSAQSQVIEQVQKLNRDDRFHGILVQLPLPPQIDERLVIASLDPDKDVDGLHPVNMGRLMGDGLCSCRALPQAFSSFWCARATARKARALWCAAAATSLESRWPCS